MLLVLAEAAIWLLAQFGVILDDNPTMDDWWAGFNSSKVKDNNLDTLIHIVRHFPEIIKDIPEQVHNLIRLAL